MPKGQSRTKAILVVLLLVVSLVTLRGWTRGSADAKPRPSAPPPQAAAVDPESGNNLRAAMLFWFLPMAASSTGGEDVAD